MNQEEIERQASQLLAAANPSPKPDNNVELDQVWARIDADLDSGQVAPGSRRRRVAIVGVAIAAVAALTAAAPFIATKTGVWNTPEWIPAGGPGEEYRLDGTDFGTELARLGADIPYPNEASRNRIMANMIDDFSGDESTVATTGTLRANLARGAICSWSHSWQEADAAADKAKRDASTKSLSSALTWPAVTDVDPKPAIDGDATDSGTGPTVFGYLPGIIDAANRGDAASLDSQIEESAWCVYWDAPATNEANTEPPPTEQTNTEPIATSPATMTSADPKR